MGLVHLLSESTHAITDQYLAATRFAALSGSQAHCGIRSDPGNDEVANYLSHEMRYDCAIQAIV